MPDATRAPSPAALADLKALSCEYGINDELITSLLASKEEARAHISFFKRMMFISNGAVMTLGLALAGFGAKRLMDGFSVVGVLCLVVGVLLFLKFLSVFASMLKSLRATEALARKHNLI